MVSGTKFAVVGAGLMGSALVFDLVRSRGVGSVTVLDSDRARLQALSSRVRSPLVRTVVLNLDTEEGLVEALRGHQCVISAAPYRYNVTLTEAAIAVGAHLCDLGGNDSVVEKQRELEGRALEAGVLVIPNCGLAPGLANVLAAGGAQQFDAVDTIRIRVGGLPQHPRPPLNYQLVFSVEGLVNEYTGKAKVLREGAIVLLDTLTENEVVEFPPPYGKLEAFLTSGGSSHLPEMFAGKVRELDYKTIRYPGHCEKFRSLFELGFASAEPMMVGQKLMTARELFLELLKKKLSGTDKDVTLLRVSISGRKEGVRRALEYEAVDSYDVKCNISSMGRLTAFPTSVIAQLVAGGGISHRGVRTPEQCVPLTPLLAELRERDVNIAVTWL